MRIPFAQIDAFADRPFAGNPAAVMPLHDWLDDATLLAIAAEHNLSETAFLVARNDDTADYDLRWFTPTVEVAMCGHATLASGHFVLSREAGMDRVRFSTRKAGVLEVARMEGRRVDRIRFVPAPAEPEDAPAGARESGAREEDAR